MKQSYLHTATLARIRIFVRLALDYKRLAKNACTVEYRARWQGQAETYLIAANTLGGMIRIDKMI
jgi:hypothetical protein